MRERPILFSGPMVRAILAGRKTQTRRVVRVDDTPISRRKAGGRQSGIPANATNVRHLGPYLKCDAPPGSATVSSRVRCPYGDPGDRLWVRETWRAVEQMDTLDDGIEFQADGSFVQIENTREASDRWLDLYERHARRTMRWRPSIFMPRWASRLTLEVTGVRVERLQAISEGDAAAEGVDPLWAVQPGGGYAEATHTDGFHALWDGINGKRAPWASNPWVWVIEFKRVAP